MDFFLLELLVLLGWPAMLALGSAWLTWHALARPWTYLVIALAALYGLEAAVFALIPARSAGYVISMATPGAPQLGPWLPLLADHLRPLAVFSVLALLLMAGLLRLLRKKAR